MFAPGLLSWSLPTFHLLSLKHIFGICVYRLSKHGALTLIRKPAVAKKGGWLGFSGAVAVERRVGETHSPQVAAWGELHCGPPPQLSTGHTHPDMASLPSAVNHLAFHSFIHPVSKRKLFSLHFLLFKEVGSQELLPGLT